LVATGQVQEAVDFWIALTQNLIYPFRRPVWLFLPLAVLYGVSQKAAQEFDRRKTPKTFADALIGGRALC
jgi:hypothetical protein